MAANTGSDDKEACCEINRGEKVFEYSQPRKKLDLYPPRDSLYSLVERDTLLNCRPNSERTAVSLGGDHVLAGSRTLDFKQRQLSEIHQP